MAESLPFRQSINISSDQIPDVFCEPCFEIDGQVKSVAGYCKDCSENLCVYCFNTHRGPKLFRHHELVDKSTRPKTKPKPQVKQQTSQNSAECLLHHGETIQAFCQQHSQLCCKVCIKINHKACKTEEISKLSRNIQDSQELTNLNKKLIQIKDGFNKNLTKTGANELVIQRNHQDACNEMNKLQEEFDKLMTETRKQADKVKEDDFEKLENVADTCNIVIDQIDKTETNMDTLRGKGEKDNLFISMKRAESQIQSLEESLKQLDKDNTVRTYKFEPEEKMKSILKELNVLGHLLFHNPSTGGVHSSVAATGNVNIPNKKVKKPVHIKDINVKSSSDKDFDMFGSVVLTNQLVLITDWDNKKVKLIDTSQNKILSEIHLPDYPFDITKISLTEYAVTLTVAKKIQILSLKKQSKISQGRAISVNGDCRGLAYISRDKTFIVSYTDPGKVEIINMSGTVITSQTGEAMFGWPDYVALSPSMDEMFVSDSDAHNVIQLTLNGDVKAVYKDSGVKYPGGICVLKSGLVYVVGRGSNTVHQLDPDSGECETILEVRDGLQEPCSISYCESENKMYIGMGDSSVLKVFQMK